MGPVEEITIVIRKERLKMGDKKRMRVLGAWLLGLSLIVAACGGAATTEAPATEGPPTANPTAEPMLENSISVRDQAVSDDVSVTIEGAISEGPGWMVVHADADGAPGPVIGFAPVNSGETENVEVSLDPEGLTGVLYAMLHVDAGAEGEYEFPGEDAPAVNDAGDVVVRSFRAYWNAVEVGDQELMEGDQVSIGRVISRTPGWLVVHADADGGPGPVIGHAPVSTGENLDVAVAVDAERLTRTLFAMLHVDVGTQGEYEFPGADAPARGPAGNVAVTPFTLTANAVNVEDQALGDGDTIEVANVLSRDPGWLVVHADDGGSPGMILGFASVGQGETTDLIVELDAEGITETLFAMLHLDEGIVGEFEFPGGEDVPARDPDGDIVTPAFQLLQNEISVEDQEVAGSGQVTIPRVESEVPGWLVVHAEADGGPGPVIGFSPVAQGISEDVVVDLTLGEMTSTLFGMLHIDAGARGEFEFPDGEDIPARDEAGDIVVLPFEVSGMASGMEEVVVEILDSRFASREITVPVGTTVVWEHRGSIAHTVTGDDRSFDSGTVRSGSTFKHTFDEPGRYPYFCEFHGAAGGIGMSGVVIVGE
jgi:plastocyanin